MLKEVFEYVVGLRKPTAMKYDDRDYTDKQLLPVQVNLPDTVEVGTLTGFIDAVGLCLARPSC